MCCACVPALGGHIIIISIKNKTSKIERQGFPYFLFMRIDFSKNQVEMVITCFFIYSVTSHFHIKPKIVSMIRKYHNHKPQTTPCHREEEWLNHHETPGRQLKQSNQLSLPMQ